MSPRTLVTCALPYANGSIHLGHLLEYIMTDVYVRGRKLAGDDLVFICADDTHGTPIELSAAKAGVSPEEYIARCWKDHVEDFSAYEIGFDHFDSTNSEENKAWAYEIYGKLKTGGYVHKKTLEQLYDEKAQRFLPDRFVKGTCPNPACNSPDQYGDVCEVCGKTHEPTDLKEPVYSVITKTHPVLRSSEHFFVDLARFKDFLSKWVAEPGHLQPETRRFVESWIQGGLKDWCISRDAPYFGFPIPDAPGKYFYVWLDAPIGYISSTERWAKKIGTPEVVNQIWRHKTARVEHVIGKDIVYFHTLFWPAMLEAAGLNVPSRVHVHGMVTADGVKLSKARGTFINARTFRKHLDPNYLRYFYASKVGPSAEDLDLSAEEFANRVNSELVNQVVNLLSRAVTLIGGQLGGRYGKLPGDAGVHLDFARSKAAEATAAFRTFDLATAVRAAVEVATLANKLFQDAQPWATAAKDPERTRDLVTLCLNLARTSVVLLSPVVPSLAAKMLRMLGLPAGAAPSIAEATAFDLVDRAVGEKVRILDRIEPAQFKAIVEEERAAYEAANPEAAKKAKEEALAKAAGAAAPRASAAPPAAAATPKARISYDDFSKIELKVGLIQAAEAVEKSKKLLKLTVDLGEARPRTILAGIRSAYEPAALVGKRVCVVANLEPRDMGRFGVSEGMVLAAGPGEKELWVPLVPEDAPAGSEIR
jgi:methionyl-tRNA synthetase